MQTLRKKNSPLKNEPTRFLGEGVSFKAKLIGILEVSEARGDRMCQAALADLKMAIRAAGEHKQRITVQISIDGLRLRDEKTGDCLYHHPVHKISFIAQDMSDSRAFGYIFGSPDTGHRFFGIKTDKAASQVVIAMRDLFQVVFELKKKEIELAKQHIEHSSAIFDSSGMFIDHSPDAKGAASGESSLYQIASDNTKSRKTGPQSGVVADLLDLQFELNSLQQGIHQMDKITPDNTASSDGTFDADPFGDSFINMKLKDHVQPILPPPPITSKRGHVERQQSVLQTPSSGTSSPANVSSINKTPPLQNAVHWFDKETEQIFRETQTNKENERKNSTSDDEKEEVLDQQSHGKQVDVFSELDPLGTGSKKPYVDKKDFFQNLKNPPKKVLKELATNNLESTFPTDFDKSCNQSETSQNQNEDDKFGNDENSFADFESFGGYQSMQSEKSPSPKSHKKGTYKKKINSLSVTLPSEDDSSSNLSYCTSKYDRKDHSDYSYGVRKTLGFRKHSHRDELEIEFEDSKRESYDRSFPINFSMTSNSPASPLKSCSSANSRLSNSSFEVENAPDPPPRGAGSILINPPPLPPKKQGRYVSKQSHSSHFQYDFLDREDTSPSPTRKSRNRSPKNNDRFDDNFTPPLPQLPKKFDKKDFKESIDSMISSPNHMDRQQLNWAKLTKDITLSELTSTYLTDLADKLGMTVQEVTSLTLQQITECIESLANKENVKRDENSAQDVSGEDFHRKEKSNVSKTSDVSTEPLFKATFDQDNSNVKTMNSDTNYDKYAVFRELLDIGKENNKKLNVQKSSEDEEPLNQDNQEETGDHEEDDAQSDDLEENISSMTNLTVKLPTEAEKQGTNLGTYYKMKSMEELTESPDGGTFFQPEENEEEASGPRNTLQEDESIENEDKAIDRCDTTSEESTQEVKKVEEIAENREKSPGLEKILDTDPEVKEPPQALGDKYAALREIIGDTEETPLNNQLLLQTPADTELQTFFPSTEIIKEEEKKETKNNVLDIFEEIKLLNSDAHKVKETKLLSSNLEVIFCPLEEKRQEQELITKDVDKNSWTKFDSNIYPPDKTTVSVTSNSPWSPKDKDYQSDQVPKSLVQRNSGESDNEWKDDESEESTGRPKVPLCCRRARIDPSFDDRPFYEDGAEEEKERFYRDKVSRKPRDGMWQKSSHRGQNSRDPRWEDDRRHYVHHKVPYASEDEYKTYWKFRSKQRPWNGDREGYWTGPECGFYEEDCGKRRIPVWNEEEHEGRERYGSQEVLGYEDEERWYRREYERRRWEEENGKIWRVRGPEGEYMSRESYKKSHDPPYYREGRDRHYDYPPSWQDDYGPSKHADESPRYLVRKKHWPKRPNSANEGRNIEMIYEHTRPVKCNIAPRSDCSDNDSDLYHRPYRSKSRDTYWGSDQEFENWGDRPNYRAESPECKSEMSHRRKSTRHRSERMRPQKPQSSPFEDDFTESVDCPEVPELDSLGVETKDKQAPSPRDSRSVKSYAKRDPKEYKGSSYFDDDLTPTASASSDTSDKPRPSSNLKGTLKDFTNESKDTMRNSYASDDSRSRDSFFNGHRRFEEDAFTPKVEEEQIKAPERTTSLQKNTKYVKYDTMKPKNEKYTNKSESVNIFRRENDPFDDDEFFN